ncbi:MAG: ribosome small subunit-dependent GTPase A [Firmicutes bacterium]|nr:ribosome small subunit-dependent GTPase A [Bacillota bacterium]
MAKQPHTNTVQARVIKILSNLFSVDAGSGGILTCSARSKLKADGGVLAGDFVSLVREGGEYVISELLPRKNSLIRPPVANIDQMVAVVAAVPKIDFYLIDKLIVNAVRRGIDVVLCLNKSDLSTELYAELCAQYGEVVDKIIVTSAKAGDICELEAVLSGKLSCFAGQSAVGKSSLINALCGDSVQKTDDLSQKVERGKNTTTRAEIIKLAPETYLIDTPGFSMLDIHDVAPEELALYYPEYVEATCECRYRGACTHTSEPACRVRELAEQGGLNRSRYERYKTMYEELKSKNTKYKI